MTHSAMQVTIALCQMNVTADKDENIQTAQRYVEVLHLHFRNCWHAHSMFSYHGCTETGILSSD